MSEETIYDSSSMILNPCIIQYGAILLGSSDGPVVIKCQIEYNISICSENDESMITSKRIKKLGYLIEAKFVDIIAVRHLTLGGNELSTSEIGKDIYADPKMLRLTEIGGTLVQTFPAAVLLKTYVENTESTTDATIAVTWEAIANDSGVIYHLVDVTE